jgi:hypothetical protein
MFLVLSVSGRRLGEDRSRVARVAGCGLREQEEKARENCPELAHRLAALVDSGV